MIKETLLDLRNKPSRSTRSIQRLTAIEAANSLEFLAAAFDCYNQKEVFAIARADIDLKKFADQVTYIKNQADTRGWGRLHYRTIESDEPAQIVFTSGTEGKPKAILLSYKNLADVVKRLNQIMQTNDEIREYIGVPVTYSFGLGRIRAVSSVNGTFYLPERFDPLEIGRMLEAGEINSVSAVPSMWRLILKNPDLIGRAGSNLRWIEIGSQYMAASEKAELKSLFPQARIVQHYGLTEASRSTFLAISDHDDAEVLESVGLSESVMISDQGAIRVRGPHVAIGTISTDGAVKTLLDSDGWLTTGDKGEIRNGYLYYLGRLDDQINLSGIKIGAEALEFRICDLLPWAKDHFSIAGVPDPVRGEAVLLAAEPPAAHSVKLLVEAARQALEERGITGGGGLHSQIVEELPRTATGKIRRADLRALALLHPSKTSGAATGADPTATSSAGTLEGALDPQQAQIAKIWRRVVGNIDVNPGTSFYDSGGDSLSGIQVGLLMESAGYDRAVINATFEGRSLGEVAALAMSADTLEKSRHVHDTLPYSTQLSWSLTLSRAIVVLSVLVSHWGPGLMSALSVSDGVSALLSPYMRMGTPAFAVIFGIGVGLFMLPDMNSRPKAVFHRIKRAFILVLSGVLILAILHVARAWLEGQQISGLLVSNAVYGVLVYYAIILGTARMWLPLLHRLRDPIRDLLLSALLLWICWQVAGTVLPSVQQDSILELPRLMLAAGYSVFKLGALTVAGIAVGYWIAGQSNHTATSSRLILFGAAGAIFCAATLLQMNDFGALKRSSELYVSLPGLAFYGSLSLLLMGLFLRIVQQSKLIPQKTHGLLRGLIVIGGMALPIYVFHQLVIPSRDILVLLGVSEILALALSMLAFVTSMVWLGRRIYRMYFA